MHERALMEDVVRKVESVARESGASRVTRVSVRLGAEFRDGCGGEMVCYNPTNNDA